MQQIIALLIGILLGIIFTVVFIRVKTARGYFKLERIPDEEELYTINMRVLPDQRLDKKKFILLSRE